MIAIIGTATALNPSEIEVSSCEGEGFGYGLLFGPYQYDTGFRVTEGPVTTVNGLEFYIGDFGWIQYLGPALSVTKEGGFSYTTYQVDEYGEEIPGTTDSHYATVQVNACESGCPVFVEVNSAVSELDGSYIEFTTVPSTHWVDGDGNGDWSSRTYLWTCDGSDWSYVKYSSSMGLPTGAVLEARKINLDAPEVLSAYAYL